MAISHIKSVTIADMTGTITVFNSAGITTQASATDIVRPSDWNSIHAQLYTLTGNTNNASTASGTNVLLSGGNGVTLIGSNSQIGISVATSYRASNDAIGLNTAQSNVTWTANSSGLSLDARGYAGTASGFTGGASISGSMTMNSVGLSVSLSHPAWITTAALSNHSHGNPTLNLTNLSGTTASNSAGLTLSLSAAAPGAVTLTNYATGNTTQSSSGTIAGSSVIVRGSGGISAGISNGSVIVHGPDLTSLSVTGALSASSNGSTISLGVGTVTANAASNTTQQSTGTIDLGNMTFQGRGGVSVGVSGGSVVISGAAGGQTGISGIIVSDATYTSGTVSFSNAGNITISSSVNGATQFIRLSGNAAQTNQSAIRGLGASNTGNTAGNTGISTGIDWVLAGSNNITVSQSTVGGGPNTLWVSGPTVGGAQTGISGIIVSDATYTSGTVSFSNAGNITISSSVNGATQFIRLSGNAAQTTQSAIRGFGVSNTGATAGNTGISTGIDWVLAGSNSLTLSQSTAGGGPNTVWIQHPAWISTARASTDALGLATAATNVTWTANSAGVSINASGYAGTGTTFAGANISGSITQNSVGVNLSLSVAPPGAATITAYAVSNTTQSTSGTIPGSIFSIQGNGALSVGVSNGSIVMSAPATSSLSATGQVSISTNGSTISIGVPSAFTKSGHFPFADMEMVAGQVGQGTLQIDPETFPAVQFDRVLVPIHNTNSSNSSGSHTISSWFGIYTRNVSSLSLLSSASISLVVTHSGTQGSYSLYSGIRNVSIPLTMTVTGGQYWVAQASRTTSGGANGSYSNLMISNLASNFLGQWSVAHNTTMQMTLGQGIYSATTSGMPASIAFSEIRGSDSNALRPPMYGFASSTV